MAYNKVQMKQKVFILGYFGYHSNQIDGQTIKTRNVYELVKKNGNGWDLSCFDTDTYKKSKLLIIKTIWMLVNSDVCIYLPGKKNLLLLFPFFFIFSKIFKVRIIYPVVGGWLAEFLKEKKFHRRLLQYIDIILVESNNLKTCLQNNLELKNVDWFPNFRLHDFRPLIQEYDNSILKLVFMGRIMKEKGIDTIFRLADCIEAKKYSKRIKISFYGPVIDEAFFYEKLKMYSFISYGGVLKEIQIYSILSTYDILLLPTRYAGEGFPGSIIDAYISGIPVVCSDWKYLKEFVINGETGYVYNLDKELDFYQCIFNLMEKSDLLQHLKCRAWEESKKYSSETAWSILREYLKINER